MLGRPLRLKGREQVVERPAVAPLLLPVVVAVVVVPVAGRLRRDGVGRRADHHRLDVPIILKARGRRAPLLYSGRDARAAAAAAGGRGGRRGGGSGGVEAPAGVRGVEGHGADGDVMDHLVLGVVVLGLVVVVGYGCVRSGGCW